MCLKISNHHALHMGWAVVTCLTVFLPFVPCLSFNIYYQPVNVEEDLPPLLLFLTPSKRYGTMNSC